MTGKERLVTRMPGTLMLLDIWKNGKILMTRASWRRELISIAGKDAKEKDLSWFDYSYPGDLSADGKTLLFDEEGSGGGLAYSKSGGLTYAVYFVKPTAPLRFCWVRAARSPCLRMVNGSWRNRLVLPRNYDSFRQASEKPECSLTTPSPHVGKVVSRRGANFLFRQ
jgi:hypothetical protein